MRKMILTPKAAKIIGQLKGVVLFSAEGQKTIPFELKLQTAPNLERYNSFEGVMIREPLNSFINN